MGKKKLNWNKLTQCYNEYAEMNYKSPKEMLADLYSKTNNLSLVGSEIGVGYGSVARQMDKLEVKRRKCSCESKIAKKIAKMDENKLAKMTIGEIAKKIGHSPVGTKSALQAMNRSYIRRFADDCYKYGVRSVFWPKFEDIESEAISKMTIKQIAKTMGCSSTIAGKLIRASGQKAKKREYVSGILPQTLMRKNYAKKSSTKNPDKDC